MKKLFRHPVAKYLVIALCAVILPLVYGFTVGGMPTEWHFALQALLFAGLFSFMIRRNSFDSLWKRLCLTLLVTVIAVVGGWAIYFYTNSLQSTFVSEYDAVVTDTYYRGGGTAWFQNPKGEERSVELHGDSLSVTSDSHVEIGDTIRVREYKGLFDVPFCTLAEQEDEQS
jgi:membrane-bound ClpP family serine protease